MRGLPALLGAAFILGSVGPARATPLTGVWTLDQADFEHQEKPPYTSAARALAAARAADLAAGKVINDDQKMCLPNGTPSMMFSEFALEVLETPGRITIVSESSPLVRTVYLNRAGPSEGLEPMWNGYSTGRYEGAVLVVHTNHFNDRVPPLGFGGTVHSPTTDMTERLSVSADGQVMTITTTMTDSKLLAAPFTLVRHFHRQPDDAEFWEYACEIGAAGWAERFPGEAKQAPTR